MSEDWEPEEFDRVDRGLSLVGWLFVGSPSADDAIFLAEIATEALAHQASGTLTADLTGTLAWRAYETLWPYVDGAEYRTAVVTDLYPQSSTMADLVPLMDEATLAYYRGYSTVALAGLFVLLEAYLRALLRWRPGDPPVSFRSLLRSLDALPDSPHRHRAKLLLDGVYGHYDALTPTAFFFNRHGLLHGLRGPLAVDRVNCARMFVLFDALVSAEIGKSFSGYIHSPAFEERLRMYESCVGLAVERQFLKKA